MKITRDRDDRHDAAFASVTETDSGGSPTFDFVLDPPTAAPALERPFALARAVAELPLSPREKELLLELGKGSTNAEIAKVLKISPATVKKHLEHIYDKLEVSGRVGALARALATRISVAIAVSLSWGFPDEMEPLFI